MKNETSVYIDLDNIGNNAKVITEKYKDYKYFIGVLKSNSYGHGEYIVNELVKNGINYIAVSYIDEAIKIRNFNKKIPILLLEPVSLSDIDKVIENKLTITVHDIDYLEEILKLDIKNKIKVHMKIDSGMNRLGFKDRKEVRKAYDLINESEKLELEGIYTHFATIGLFDKHYDDQVKRFKIITALIDLKDIPIVHLGSSVILLSHPKLSFATGVRMGIVLYGYNVSPTYSNKGLKNKLRNIRNKHYQKKYNISPLIYNTKLDLKPAMSMTTSILQIKKVRKGETIGYGASYKAKEDMKVAILPVGYNNGIGRKNIDRFVIINSKKCPVVGEMSMNMMIVKVDKNVELNDKVYILGGGITLGMLSRMDGSSISGTLLNIGKNNKKTYLKNDKIEYVEE